MSDNISQQEAAEFLRGLKTQNKSVTDSLDARGALDIAERKKAEERQKRKLQQYSVGETALGNAVKVFGGPILANKKTLREPSGQLGSKTLSFLRRAWDNNSLGFADDAYAAVKTLTTPNIGGKGLGERYNAAIKEYEIGSELAKDEIGTVGDVTSGVVGAFNPLAPTSLLSGLFKVGSLANKARKNMDAGIKLGLGPLGIIKNTGVEAAVGAAETIITKAAENDIHGDIRDVIEVGIGAGGGAVGQLLIGEIGGAIVKYGPPVSSRTATGVGTRLFDTGPTIDGTELGGFTPSHARSQVEILNDEAYGKTGTEVGEYKGDQPNNFDPNTGRGLFDLDLGGVSRADLMRRIGDTLAKTHFDSYDIAKPEDRAAYVKMVTEVGDIINGTSERIRKNIAEATAPSSTSSYGRWKAGRGAKRRAEASDQYDRLYSLDQAGKAGNRKVRFSTIRDNIFEGVKREFKLDPNMTKEDVVAVLGEDSALLNDVLRSVSPTGVHKRGTSFLYRSADELEDDLGVQDIDLDSPSTTVPLVRLFKASKKLSEEVQAGMIRNGNRVTPTQHATAVKLKKVIDYELAKRTMGADAKARKAFFDHMQIVEAKELGDQFYKMGLREDPNTGMNLDEYLNSLDSQAAKQAFKQGYKEAFAAATAANGPVREITNLIGVNDLAEGLTDLGNIKTAAFNDMKTVLGKKEAEEFLAQFYDDQDFLLQAARLRQTLRDKGYNNEAINGVIKDADEFIMSGAFTGNNSFTDNASLNAFARYVKALDQKAANRVAELMTTRGAALADNLDEVTRRMMVPRSRRVGGQVAGGTVAPFFAENSEATAEDIDEAKGEERSKLREGFDSYQKEIDDMMRVLQGY